MKLNRPLRMCLALLLSGAVMIGCASTTRVHGYIPTDAEIASVTPGVDNAESIAQKLGRPSSSGILRDSAWYYVQSTVENYTYNRPRVIDRSVVAVEYTPNGVVSGIARYGLEDGRVVNLNVRTTETGGRTLGVVEQLFGNLLNLDAEQFVDQ